MPAGVIPVTCSLAALAVCSALPEACIPWDRVGNAEFRARLDGIAGEHAVDCGFINLLTGRPARRVRSAVLGCIAEARRLGVAFKYGTARAPMDSFVSEVYVELPGGQAWLLAYDEMPLDGFASYWVRSCDDVDVDRRTLIITGRKCSDHRDGSEVAQ